MSDLAHLARFIDQRFLVAGETYDFVEAIDTENGGQPVILKALRTPDGMTQEERDEWRKLSTTEIELLNEAAAAEVFPRLIDTLSFDGQDVLVMEKIEGVTLDRWLAANYPDGAPQEVVVPLLKPLFEKIGELEHIGWIGRTFRPDHVVITPTGAKLFGSGRWMKRVTKPTRGRGGTDSVWSAPEIDREMTGKFLNARADIYALGLLLAFMLTNTRPTGHPETPLTPEGWKRLGEASEGLRLLVAHCLQPMQRERLANAQRVSLFLEPGEQPELLTYGFVEVGLAAPWDISYGGPGAQVHGLSPGPLVVRHTDIEDGEEEPETAGESEPLAPDDEPGTVSPADETLAATAQAADDEDEKCGELPSGSSAPNDRASAGVAASKNELAMATPDQLEATPRAKMWIAIISALVLMVAILAFVRQLG